MTDSIRYFMNAEPFVRFLIKTSDGKQYRLRHPDYLAISPKGGRVTVYDTEETGAMLSTLHIVAVEPQASRKQGRATGR